MTLEEARTLDAADPLRGFRDRFALPDGVIYLDGNSLGPLPRRTAERLEQLVHHQWGERLIRSWNEAGWTAAPTRIGDKIARLIGAAPGEVVATDSTSVCLFKLLSAAAATRDGAIAAQADGFPTDRYLAETIAAQLGRPFRAVDDPADALAPDIAAAVLTEVDYRLGSRLDMAALSARAAETGTLLVWDLSHSVGAVPLDLGGAGARLAVGCGYKYLNGGPGAPAFLYVARDLQAGLAPTIAGWWGHDRPFDFAPTFRPADGITRFLSGTPPMLALVALEAGVDLMLEAEPAALRAKGIALWDLFTGEIARRCPALRLRTPTAPHLRGSHAIFQHDGALAIVRAAIERSVIGDYRPTGLARFGITPLYLSFEDVWRAAGILAEVVNGDLWRDPRFGEGGAVT
jgi:kynureninase